MRYKLGMLKVTSQLFYSSRWFILLIIMVGENNLIPLLFLINIYDCLVMYKHFTYIFQFILTLANEIGTSIVSLYREGTVLVT